jgi:hypothetical protein
MPNHVVSDSGLTGISVMIKGIPLPQHIGLWGAVASLMHRYYTTEIAHCRQAAESRSAWST